MISPRPALSPGSFLAFRAGAASSTTDHTAAGSSFYDVLGLRPGASAREIKAAYRRLARAVHPDAAAASHSSAEDFMRVHAAYATLSDPDRRAVYDRRLLLASAAGRSTSFPARCRPRTWETDQCW